MLRDMKLVLLGRTPFLPSVKDGEGEDARVLVIRVSAERGMAARSVQRRSSGGGERPGCVVAAGAPWEWLLQTLISPSLKKKREPA